MADKKKSNDLMARIQMIWPLGASRLTWILAADECGIQQIVCSIYTCQPTRIDLSKGYYKLLHECDRRERQALECIRIIGFG